VPTKLIGAIYRDIEIRKEATGINVELSRAIYTGILIVFILKIDIQ
jgi:hypothetical protein